MRRYLWGVIPAIWFWMLIVIGVGLWNGDRGTTQLAVDLLSYSTVLFLILGVVTTGAAETTKTDCMVAWIWSLGFYALVIPGVAVFVVVKTIAVASLMAVGIEGHEFGAVAIGIAVLTSAWVYYRAARRWMSFVVWWGNTIRFRRSLTYARCWVRWLTRSTRSRWIMRRRPGPQEKVA